MDHSITVAPGAEFPVQAAGDFVFCKFADRDIRVIIQSSPRTMRAGSKWRPAGGFEAGDVIVQNPDPVNPVAVVLTIGVGDFDDQIIRGDVTVTPVLRSADGSTKQDTRTTVEMQLDFTEALNVEWEQHQEKETVTLSGAPAGGDTGFLFCATPDGYVTATPNNSADTLNYFSRDGIYQRSVEIFDIPEPIYPGSPLPTGHIKGLTYNPFSDSIWFINNEGLLYEVVGRGPGLKTAINLYSITTDDLSIAQGLSFVSGTVVAVATVYDMLFIDLASGSVISRIEDLPGSCSRSVAYVPELSGVIYCTTGTKLPKLALLTGDVEDLPVDDPVSGAAYDSKNRQYVLNEQYGNLRVHSEADVSYFATGSAIRTECGAVSAVLRRGEERIESAVYVIDDGGEITVSGQLIRAALELYGGGQPMPDYLDSVYAFQVLGQTVSVETGGSSFAAAKQADEFTMMAPAIVRLTIDNDMTWS
ncbi:MAG TPA: hypothetical protein DD411_06220 [Alcanivorax sp.]|jgi:hypothetical protein|nr:hypothetical protein [Alcanivorax sp.]|tara:strand:+ start:7917 stop:9338 length:1422 start_codon:yes stop_codon:yes gene_type:complete